MKSAVASSSSRGQGARLLVFGAGFSALLLAAACSSSDDADDAVPADSGAAAGGDASFVADASGTADATSAHHDAAPADAAASADGTAADGASDGANGTVADSGSGPESGAEAGGGGVDPKVHLYGRMDRSDVAGPRFDWSGSSVAASFTGTGIAVRLGNVDTGSGPNRMQAVIDGVPSDDYLPLDDSADETYVLASGLTDGDHTVELYKRTEGSYGAVQFLGFQTEDAINDAGWALTASVAPTRRIEIIGDSISAGYGVLSPSIACDAAEYLDYQDAYLTYGLDTARATGASAVSIARSGTGVYRDYNGDTSDIAASFYPLTLFTDTLTYDFAQQVDVVLVNFGTNDFHLGDPGQENFETAYVDLVTTIRGHYPAAYILLLTGPMVDSNFPFKGAIQLLDGYVDDVVSTRQAAGDTSIADLHLMAQNCADEQCGCDSHPDVDRQQTMSNSIVKKLKGALGW